MKRKHPTQKRNRLAAPPEFKPGEYLDTYDQKEPLYSLTLDRGSFIFVWEYVHRANQRTKTASYYLAPEVVDVARRSAEVFSAASGLEPVKQPQNGSGRSAKGKKKERCPATNKAGKRCLKVAGHSSPHKTKN